MIINIYYDIILLEYEGGEKMEFLYKLYDNEYFGIALFIVIAILIFLFLLILFFGKKDEKKRKLEETKRLELKSANAFKETNESVESLEIPEIAQPNSNVNTVQEEIKSNEEVVLNTPKLDTNSIETLNENSGENLHDVQSVESSNNSKESNVTIDLPEFNTSEEKNTNDDLNIDNLFQTNLELPKEEDVDNQVFNMEMPEIKEEKQVMPKVEAPFSSVYINKDEEINNNIELPKENVQPLGFELPKMVENDTLNKEKENTEEPVEISKVSDFDSLFGDLENETYNINK